ncbi:iron-siderophore ABC transporter substrate-binding protein [Vibrio comitans]|uniref:ABC transporter substrate-binding protein n=1 Tax=Vibrio comitans NBRC 102076 TaxID=1219078 RepID=A0A4Y3IPP9_9VIBR|nr:iron-siderophore ABC transporter substrate-binding protein [Vibrio comitans]GEA61489.1 ABC transporter substrate-binding protein [Vibrio comitans NBRC 102076]
MKNWILGLCMTLLSFQLLAFPLEIENKFGVTKLSKQPVRIVSVGVSDQDDLLALGIKPLATREWYGNQPYAVWPWAQDELGDAKPVVLKGTSYDYEQIASLKPDLIVGVSSGMTLREYEQLSTIAPTLAQSSEYPDWMMPWNEKHRMIGQAVGLEAQAEQNVQNIVERLNDVKAAHPEFKGKTAVVAFYYNKQPGAYASKDLRSKFLTELGFVIPEQFDQLAGSAFYASFSEERLNLLETDVLIWLGEEKDIDSASTSAFRKRMPFHREGREYFTGNIVGGAFSFYSPLSINYLIDEMVPEIAKIIGNN